MNPYVRLNRDLWDEWADINYRSAFYDVAGFVAAMPPLDDVTLAGLGDLTGKRVLHLQCHFGMDTIRVAALARDVVGVDFSPRAIELARGLAARVGSAARFLESDVYALDVEPADVVFTSVGVLGWLPDLRRWGQVVAKHLVPGGHVFLLDGHPTMLMFDGEAPELRVACGYFHDDAPTAWPPKVGNYADPTATVTKTEYAWQHGLADIVMALVDAGLVVEELREHRHTHWKAMAFLVEDGPDRFVMPPGMPAVPLMFSLRARKPG